MAPTRRRSADGLLVTSAVFLYDLLDTLARSMTSPSYVTSPPSLNQQFDGEEGDRHRIEVVSTSVAYVYWKLACANPTLGHAATRLRIDQPVAEKAVTPSTTADWDDISVVVMTRRILFERRFVSCYDHRPNHVYYVPEPRPYRVWYKNNQRHRDFGLPAVCTATAEEWWRCDRLHRGDDQPARVEKRADDGPPYKMIWCRDGVPHRDDDRPAFVECAGIENVVVHQRWYRHGKLHREGDEPAYVHELEGAQRWYRNGACHRDDDQPAIVSSDGTRQWYCHGMCHRDGDKPAVECRDGIIKHWCVACAPWQCEQCSHFVGTATGSVIVTATCRHRSTRLLASGGATGSVIVTATSRRSTVMTERGSGTSLARFVLRRMRAPLTSRRYRNGYKHRDGDKPAVITWRSTKKWYVACALRRT